MLGFRFVRVTLSDDARARKESALPSTLPPNFHFPFRRPVRQAKAPATPTRDPWSKTMGELGPGGGRAEQIVKSTGCVRSAAGPLVVRDHKAQSEKMKFSNGASMHG